MKLRYAILAMLFGLIFCPEAHAQAIRFDGVVQSRSGFPAAGATIAVCGQPAVTTTQPCSPLATLYTDATGGTQCSGTLLGPGPPGSACSNPMVADGLGNYHFYISPASTVTLQFYGSGLTPYLEPDQTIGAGGGGNVGPGTSGTIAKFTGNTTIGNSLVTENGTTLTYTGANGITTLHLNSSSGSAATGSFMNMAAADCFAWPSAQGGGTKLTLCKDSLDDIVLLTPLGNAAITGGSANGLVLAGSNGFTGGPIEILGGTGASGGQGGLASLIGGSPNNSANSSANDAIVQGGIVGNTGLQNGAGVRIFATTGINGGTNGVVKWKPATSLSQGGAAGTGWNIFNSNCAGQDCTFTFPNVATGTICVTSTCTGAPGGSPPQVQYNSSGTFAGIPNVTFANSALTALSGNFLISGSGGGLLTPAYGGPGNSTATFPVNTGTIGELNLAQTWTASQTFSNGITADKLDNIQMVDGVTNTTIQQAVNKLPAGGGAVYIPPGTYAGPTTPTNGWNGVRLVCLTGTLTPPVMSKTGAGVATYSAANNCILQYTTGLQLSLVANVAFDRIIFDFQNTSSITNLQLTSVSYGYFNMAVINCSSANPCVTINTTGSNQGSVGNQFLRLITHNGSKGLLLQGNCSTAVPCSGASVVTENVFDWVQVFNDTSTGIGVDFNEYADSNTINRLGIWTTSTNFTGVRFNGQTVTQDWDADVNNIGHLDITNTSGQSITTGSAVSLGKSYGNYFKTGVLGGYSATALITSTDTSSSSNSPSYVNTDMGNATGGYIPGYHSPNLFADGWYTAPSHLWRKCTQAGGCTTSWNVYAGASNELEFNNGSANKANLDVNGNWTSNSYLTDGSGAALMGLTYNGTSCPTSNASEALFCSNPTGIGTLGENAGTNFPILGGNTIANASSTGTTLYTVTKVTGAPSTAVIYGTADTVPPVGITVGGAGTTGSAFIRKYGQLSCVFDNATTAGDIAVPSTTVAGNCHDSGATTDPASGWIYGTVLSTNGGAGTYVMDFYPRKAGGGSASVIDPTNPKYAGGVKADGHFSTKAVFTNGSAVITCSDCNFTGTDAQGRAIAKAGQVLFGSSATTDTSEATSTITLAETTILSIDSATQIHANANVNCGGACGATSTLFWGDLDSLTSGGGAQSTSNDPMYSAWNAAGTNCLPLVLPAGVMLIERAPFNVMPTDGCNQANSLQNVRRGFEIHGYGDNESIIVITPNFPSTDCTGPNGSGTACFLSAPNPILRDFQIWGGGNSDPGAGFAGKALVVITGVTPGINFELTNLQLHGFSANRGTTYGLYIGNGSTTVSGGTIKSVNVEGFGSQTCTVDAGLTNTVIFAYSLWCNVSNVALANELVINAGTFNSFGGLYGTGTSGASAFIKTGAIMNSTGDILPYPTTSAQFSCTGSGSQLNIVNDQIINTNGAGYGIYADTGCKVKISNSYVSAKNTILMGASNGSCSPTCVFSSGGNNTFVTSGTLYTTSTGASSSSVFISPTDTYTASTTLQPTCTFTSGGGSTPSCALQTGSTDEKGVIIATTGTGSPGTTGTITLTFVGTHSANGNTPACNYSPDDSGTAWGNMATTRVSTQSTTAPVMAWSNSVGGTLTALATSSPYRIDYSCTAR